MRLLPLAYVAMGVCYFLALRSPTNGFWYPPIAFGKLMLLVYGPRALLPVLASELALMGVQYVLVADMGFLAAGAVSLATTAEGLLAWQLLRARPIDASLAKPRDLLRLLTLGGLLPNLAGAVLGLALLHLVADYGDRQIAPAALLWAFGDFVTTVTWLPAFVLWFGPSLCHRRAPNWPTGLRLLEFFIVLFTSVATCVFVAVGITQRPDWQQYNLKFLCFLPLIWAGTRFGLLGATASLAAASTTWALLYGNAQPQNFGELAETIEQVQVFNLALAVGGLMLGWSLDAERRAQKAASQLALQLQENQTKLREAFDAIAAAQDQAYRAGQVKYRLLSAVSHELRTPLTPMTLLLAELTARRDLPPEVQESAQIIMRQVETEAAVVEELLEYADLMCGADMRGSETTLPSLMSRLTTDAELAAREAGVPMRFEVAADHRPLWIDQRRVARAIDHVIHHALQQSRPGSTITVSARFDADQLHVCVHLTTATADRADRTVVKPFAATDHALSDINQGLGLSLATAQLVAHRHRGALIVTDSPATQSITYELRLCQNLTELAPQPAAVED